MPAPGPAGPARTPGPQGQPDLQRPTHPGHRRRRAHRQTDRTPAGAVRAPEYIEVEATGGIYQRMIAAYREPDRGRGREVMRKLIDYISTAVPGALTEVMTLGRTLRRRAGDVLASFDAPAHATGRPKRSTDASSASADQPSAFATSPTTSPDACSRPAGSGPDYTPDCVEPEKTRRLPTASATSTTTDYACSWPPMASVPTPDAPGPSPHDDPQWRRARLLAF